jgi:hypothetical protein
MVVMDKRCLAMVLYNPTAAKAAVEQQEPATKRPRPSPAEEAGAVIPYNDAAPPAAMVPYNQWRSSPYGWVVWHVRYTSVRPNKHNSIENKN